MTQQYLKNVATLQLDSLKCTGCGICTQVCPHEVFTIEKGKALVQAKDNCMECGACAKNCPFQAVTVEAGVGCAFAILRGKLTNSPPSCDCSPSGDGDSCC